MEKATPLSHPALWQGGNKSIIMKSGPILLFLMNQTFNLYDLDIVRGHQRNPPELWERDFALCTSNTVSCREKKALIYKQGGFQTQTRDTEAQPLQDGKRLKNREKKKLKLEGKVENL